MQFLASKKNLRQRLLRNLRASFQERRKNQTKATFSSLEELVINMCINQDDFEDLDITKDILFASNDLKEIAHWYLTSFLSLPEPDPKMFDDGDEYLKFCERKIKQKKYYDNISVLFDFINNNVEIDAIDIKLSDAKIKEKLKDEMLDMFEEA